MSHQFRFHISPDRLQDGELVVEGQEAHHAIKVARVQLGERVTLFDGHGRVAAGRVTDLERNSLVIAAEVVESHSRSMPQLILLAGATTKGKAVEETIRASVPFEPTKIGFFTGDRSNHKRMNPEKWLRWSVEAAKQCGSAWVPEFRVYDSLRAAIQANTGTQMLVGLPESTEPVAVSDSSRTTIVVIGPEGGFSAEEHALIEKSGGQAFSLGPNVLRTELAAPVALAQVRAEIMRMNRG